MTATSDVSGWQLGARLAHYLPRHYFGVGTMWAGIQVLPVASGLVLKAVFDRITDGGAVDADSGLWLLVAFVAVEAVRQATFWIAIMLWPYWWNGASTVVAANVLRSIVSAPGPAATRLPASSGEAVNRFRDDVQDLVLFTDMWVDFAGDLAFAAIAIPVMLAIDPVVTVVIVLPMFAVVLLTRALGQLIRRYHRNARRSGALVAAFIGDLFGGVLALKAAGSEDAALARFRERNRARRRDAVRARVLQDVLRGTATSTVELSVGLVLLLAAPAMRRGDFTVGDLALFTAYLGWLANLPRRLGFLLYRQQQATVAGERLGRLLTEEEGPGAVVDHRPVYLRSAPPPVAPVDPVEPFEHLDVCGLTAVHPLSGAGVVDVTMSVPHGSFTVITGAVGSGKTTLVRAVLGLLPRTAGEIRWNGEPIADPGLFFVPPRVAYASQVPRLFSDSLAENILLGLATDSEGGTDPLTEALHLAVLDRDVAALPAGLETLVGPRGVRLSGGQVQRVNAARALVRSPQLLVVDDLSSALDVETEERLWDRIASRGPATCLVVSHRRSAFARADQIVVLEGGRVAGCGPLDELIGSCPEMRRLWTEESVVEAEEELTA
jgi:ATP-binding cassette, subfamily B, bacterial